MPQIVNFEVETRLLDNFTVEISCGNQLIIKLDQPRHDDGNDTEPCPVEYLLGALSGCVATMFRMVANQNGIKLNGLNITTRGELDAEGLFGRNKNVRPGLNTIEMDIDINADIGNSEKENLTKEVIKRCPSWDNLENNSPLTYNLV